MSIEITNRRGGGKQSACCITLASDSGLNTLDLQSMREIKAALEAAWDCRQAVVITNKPGTAFCAGLDRFELLRSCATVGSCATPLDALIDLYQTIAAHPHPTGCCLNGHAAGGGVGLALCCDVAVAAPDIELRLPGSTYRRLAGILLPYIAHRNPELGDLEDFIGREYSATDAQRIGLLDSTTPEELWDRLDAVQPKSKKQMQFSPDTLDLIDTARDRALSHESTKEIACGLLFDIARSVHLRLGQQAQL